MAEEDLFETGINKGANHPVWMTDQVDVTRLGKVALSAPQHLDIERVRRSLVHEDTPASPRLHQPIKLLRRELLLFTLFHQACGGVGVTLLDLHQRPNRSFAPEAEAIGKRFTTFGECVERQKLQLRRRK